MTALLLASSAAKGSSILLAIVALGVLVIVHELGHFVVARLSKMRVERFSLGFGPPVAKWRVGETQFQLAPILIGGFVHIVGMNPHEEFDEQDPQVYPNRPTWQRILTIFAGPFTNFLLAVFLIFAVFAAVGVETGYYRVDETVAGKPADGKLLPGDRVLAIDGRPITFSPSGFRDRVQASGGRPIEITVLRGGAAHPPATITLEVTPQRDEKGQLLLGLVLGRDEERRQVGVGAAAGLALEYPVTKSGEILTGLWEIITNKIPPEFTGPVGITKMIGRTIRAGWVTAFEFLAVLSVYLGLFNLLPIPALDGARIVFLGYELVTRRRPNPKVEAAIHMVGFVFLMLLILLVTFKDIRGLF